MKIWNRLKSVYERINASDARFNLVQEALGRIEARQTRNASSLREAEFRVFSQSGEDGIIQYLITRVPLPNKTFIEFGVQDYVESNTRFLLVNNNWKGLILDGSQDNIERIRNSDLYWRYDLRAERIFVTRENINDILRGAGFEGDIGILSIDVDGNDYWIWQAIDVVSPRIVVIEYNWRFGAERAVTIPYDPAFVRREAHYSMIYYGASLSALARLGRDKGYSLVGSSSAGNNAFFVRDDLLGRNLNSCSVEDAYVAASFREARDNDGKLSFPTWEEEQQILASLPMVDVDR